MIGQRLGHFVIVEKLGEGGMGVVYRARDERLQRDVALKFLSHASLQDETSKRYFRREALALSRLNHPNIATVHDIQSDGDTEFLVMEYIGGESLDARVARGPLPESELVEIGLQLSDALATAHRLRVIHRDLKPANLKLTSEGRLKVLDFGLAKWRATEVDTASTLGASEAGGLTGTPAYMAPEVLRGAPADERSDLWGAGLVLYELATGTRAFSGMPLGTLFDAILNQDVPSARSRNPAMSAELAALIGRCLEKRPEKRFANADALAEGLQRLKSPASAPRRGKLARLAHPAVLVPAAVIAIAIAWALQAFWPAIHAPNRPIRLLVLPFKNVSGDALYEYFSVAMAEELISNLNQARSLSVLSLTTAMQVPERHEPLPAVARRLGVDRVIEGGVLRSGAQLRITVHLVDAAHDRELWSGQYTGDTSDVLGLLSRTSQAIADEVVPRLNSADRERVSVVRHVDPAAYDLYIRGRYQWARRSDPGIRLALDYFEQAIRIDSTYAPFHCGLADAWAAAGLYGVVSPIEAAVKARAAALRAVRLEPGLSEAHTSLGNVLHNFDWDWEGAEREYRRAIALNPKNATARHWHGHLLAQNARFGEARVELEKARALDPLSISIVQAVGVNEYFARRYPEALEALRRAREIDSTSSLLHRTTAGVLDRLGRERDAMHELARSFELRGSPRWRPPSPTPTRPGV